jgi:hypothetical protein
MKKVKLETAGTEANPVLMFTFFFGFGTFSYLFSPLLSPLSQIFTLSFNQCMPSPPPKGGF